MNKIMKKASKGFKISIQEIATLAIYLSVMLVLTFVPYTGYLNIGPIAITLLPVFISIATWHAGWKGGMVTSLAFGFGSYFKSLAGMGSPLFINFPELAIVPRILMGIAMGLIVKSLGEIKVWKTVLTGGLAVLLNTLFVTAWYFFMKFYRDQSDLKTFSVWMYLIYVNFLVELSVGIALGLVTSKLTKYLRKNLNERKELSY